VAKRIVISTIGSYGDLHPYIAVGRGLRARGHEVLIATSARYAPKVHSAGLGFHPVFPDFADLGNDEELVRRVYHPRRGAEYLVRELILPHLPRTFDDLHAATKDADLLVTHALSYAGPLVAASRQMPWVSTILSPMVFLSVHDPPRLTLIPWLKSVHRFSPGLYRLLFGALKIGARRWSDPVRRLARQRGLPPPARDPLFEGQFSPHLTLALFSSSLAQAQPDWPAHTHITGFPLYDEDAVDPGAMQALDRFLDAGEPPLVFTLGSSAIFLADGFYRRAAEIVQRMGRRAVLITGRVPDNQRIPARPPGIFVTEYAPYSRVFPRAAAIVHQGGIGTLAQAMHAGRPMLVVPFSHDQPDNAERAERLGIARHIAPKRFSVEQGMRELRALLSDSSYAASSIRVARQLRNEDGIASACDRLERLLG
jgi:UDP:flavonoid glycosyltransferase YjiC (YdhE family)